MQFVPLDDELEAAGGFTFEPLDASDEPKKPEPPTLRQYEQELEQASQAAFVPPRGRMREKPKAVDAIGSVLDDAPAAKIGESGFDPMVRPEYVEQVRQELGQLPVEQRLAALRKAAEQGNTARGRAAKSILFFEEAENAKVEESVRRQAAGMREDPAYKPSGKPGARKPALPVFPEATPNFIQESDGITPEQVAKTNEIARGFQSVRDEIRTNPVIQQQIQDAALSQRRQEFAQASPNLGAMASGAGELATGLWNAVPLAADFFNKVMVDPLLNLVGLEPMGRVPVMPGTESLKQAAADLMPQVSRLSYDEAKESGKFGEWMLTKLSANSPQMGAQLAAAFFPPLRAALLPGLSASAGGSAYVEGDDSRVAATKGVIEYVTEQFSAGTFDKVGDLIQNLTPIKRDLVLAVVGQKLLQAGSALTLNSVSNATEEVMAQLGGNVLDKYVSGKKVELDSGLKEAGLIGAVTGGAMSLPQVAGSLATDNTPQGQVERALADALSLELADNTDQVVAGANRTYSTSGDIRPDATAIQAQDAKLSALRAERTKLEAMRAAAATPEATAAVVTAPDVQTVDQAIAAAQAATQAPAQLDTALEVNRTQGDAAAAEAVDTVIKTLIPNIDQNALQQQINAMLGQPTETEPNVEVPAAATPDAGTEGGLPPAGVASQPVEAAGLTLPSYSFKLNDTGTLSVSGDTATALDILAQAGITSGIIKSADGIRVSVQKAPAAKAALEAAVTPPSAPAESEVAGQPVVLQNRDRTSAASVAQMTEIAANPDYLRTGPSREMQSGSPVVLGDLPKTAVAGRTETVVDGKGDRIQARYAVVEAADLLPSNRADGTPNPEYANGLPGKLRAVAGNGRTAGIQAAYERGTADGYKTELLADAENLGVDPAAVRAMKAPVLVRLMRAADVKADMGDRTNISSTQELSPVEQATNDARRVNIAGLQFDDNGDPTPQTLRAFIARTPVSERGRMQNPDGTPTRQAVDRLMAATFKVAYGSDELVQLYAQATDPEARAVISAVADAAGVMANLEGTGQYDIRAAVAGAAKMAVNASRQGLKLADVVKNADLDMDAEAFGVAQFMADNIRSPKRMAEGLRAMGQQAAEQARIEAENAQQDAMFGATPTIPRQQILESLNGTAESPVSQLARVAGDGQAVTGDRQAAGPAGAAPDLRGVEGEAAAGAQAEGLTAPTEAEVLAAQDRADNAEALDEREQVRKESEAGAGSFLLEREDGRQDTTGFMFSRRSSIVSKIRDLFRIAISHKDGNKAYADIGSVTDEVASRIKSEANLDVAGYVHSIDESAIRHILKEHGDPATEERRGQLAITEDDIASIPSIVADPDVVLRGEATSDNRPTLIFKKKLGDSYVYVQEVRDRRGKLAAKTLWKTRIVPPATAEAGEAHTSETSVRSTSTGQTDLTTDSSDGQVRRSFAGTNSKTADTRSLATAQERLQAGDDAELVRQETGWSKSVDGKWRYEISDADASFIGKDALERMAEADPYKLAQTTLGEVLDHPALFAAYPDLRNVNVVYEATSAAGGDLLYGASYNSEDNTITLGNGLSSDEMLSALLHEVQHNLQFLEGFATGGSPNSIEGLTSPEASALLKRADALMTAGDIDGGMRLMDEAKAVARKFKMDRYRRLAGEVEARNTQARQRMTDAERRATPPSATADVADSDVIVTFNGKVAENAPAPANGVKPSFAGVGAETSDWFSLHNAQDMLERGIDPERVRRETGWSRDVDGKWKFEISDDEARLLLNFPDAGTLGEALSRIQSEFGVATLQSFLSHDKLFAAYPHLRRTMVYFASNEELDGARGSYSPSENHIKLNRSILPDQALSTLMHEVQHAIQEYEGFARGGNADTQFARRVKQSLEGLEQDAKLKVERWSSNNYRTVADAERTAAVARNALMYESAQRLMAYANRDKPSGVFRLIKNEIQWIYHEDFRGNQEAMDLQRMFYSVPPSHRMKERNAYIRDMAERASQLLQASIPREQLQAFRDDERTTQSMVAALQRQANKAYQALAPLRELEQAEKNIAAVRQAHEYSTPFEIYQSLAGEVEARNTQARLKMTAEERRNKSPLLTADVKPENVVVMFGGLQIEAPMLSLEGRPTHTPDQLREAARKSHGNLLDQGERKGLVKLAGLDELIDQAAKDRAAVTGGDWQEIKAAILKSVQNSVAPQRELDADGMARLQRVAEIVAAGNSPSNQIIQLGRTPAVLRMLGASDVRLTFDPLKLHDALKPGKKHSLTPGVVVQAIRHLSDPVAVMESRTKAGDMVALTEVVAEDGRPMVVAVALDKRGGVKAINKVSSVYAKDDAEGFLSLNLRENRFRFVNNEKRRSLPEARRLQLPIGGANPTVTSSRATSVGANILSEVDLVNFEQGVEVKRSANGDINGFHDPKTGKSYLNADVLTPDAIGPVLIHEMWHGANQAGALDAVNARAAALIRAGKGNPFFDRVAGLMRDAGETSNEEAAAYLVQAWEQDTINAPAPVVRWVKNLVAAIRAWLFNKGIILKADQLTEADIAAVARMMAKEQVESQAAQGDGDVKASQAKFENSTAFKRWFAGSKVVDADGKALVVYHGTWADFNKFDLDAESMHWKMPGFYFAPNPEDAGRFAESSAKQKQNRLGRAFTPEGANVMPVYLSLQNPKTIEFGNRGQAGFVTADEMREMIQEAQFDGHDGVIIKGWKDGSGDVQYVAFRPEQIKSATGNAGTYDPANPDIRYSKMADPSKPLSEKQFYRTYYQHRMLRGPADAEAIMRDGWQEGGIGPNVLPAYQGGQPSTILERKYMLRAGDTALLIPKEGVRDTPNGPKVKAGWKPQPYEIVQITSDGPAMYQEYLKGFNEWAASQAKDDDIRFSRGSRQGSVFASQFNIPDETRLQKFQRKIQDQYNRVKIVQDLLRQQGGNVSEATDVYRAEERMHGIVQEKMIDLRDQVLEPLLKKTAQYGIELDELALYAYAKHAQERNAYISGLRNDMPDNGSGMTNQEAQDILDQVRQDGKEQQFEELHRTLMQINQMKLDAQLQSGLISQNEYGLYMSQYQNYVPLRGFEAVGEDGKESTKGKGTGKRFNIRGKESMRALGRTSRAADIVENLITDYQVAVVRSEKNRVLQRFLQLVIDNPDPTLWEIDAIRSRAALDRATGKVSTTFVVDMGPDTLGLKINGQEIYLKIHDPLLLRAMRGPEDNKVATTARMVSDVTGHYLDLLRNTITRFNPEFAMTNLQRDLGMAQLMVIDELGEKGGLLFAKHYAGATAASAAQLLGKLGKMSPEWQQYFTEYREAGGTTGGFYVKDADELRTDLRMMMVAAGAEPKTAYERLVKVSSKIGLRHLGKSLEFLGQTSEHAARVAAFRAAREMGKSPAQAAAIAKNLTTNFNRKGEWGGLINSAYLFFNANVQGNARLLRALKNPKVAKYLAGMVGATAALAMWNAGAGGEDDDGELYWDKIPQHIKERNLIIMLPPGFEMDGAEQVGTKGRYVTWAAPFGLNTFSVLGYELADMYRHAQNPMRGHSPGRAAWHLASATAASMNPFGGSLTSAESALLMVMPTVLDLPVQFAIGVDAFGRPVAPASYDEDSIVKSEQVNVKQSGGPAHMLARWVNDISGGDQETKSKLDFYPGSYENVARNAVGGAGKFVYDAIALAGKAFDDNPDIFVREIPFVRRNYGEVDGDVDQGLFYERRAEVNEARAEEKRKEAADKELTDPEKIAKASLSGDAADVTKRLSEIRRELIDLRKDATVSDTYRKATERQLKRERDELITEFNRRWRATMEMLAKEQAKSQ